MAYSDGFDDDTAWKALVRTETASDGAPIMGDNLNVYSAERQVRTIKPVG